MEEKINKIFDKINMLDKISNEVNETNQDVKELKQNYKEVNQKLSEMEKTIETQKNLIERLENQVKKRNLILYGIPEEESSASDLESTIISLLKNKLKIEISSTDIEEVFRLGKKGIASSKIRPVLLSLSSKKIKSTIMKQRKLFTGTTIIVSEDLTKTERLKRIENYKQNKKRGRQSSEDTSPKIEQKPKSQRLTTEKTNNTLDNFLGSSSGRAMKNASQL